MDLLPLASLNSMTLLGAETVGRAYGGGMLKLEPKEADLLPVPDPRTLDAARPALAAIRPQVAARLRQPRGLLEAAKLVDDVLLIGELGMARSDVKDATRGPRRAHRPPGRPWKGKPWHGLTTFSSQRSRRCLPSRPMPPPA